MNADKLIKELCAHYKNLFFVNFMQDIIYPNNQESMIVADHRMVDYYNQHQIPTLCTDYIFYYGTNADMHFLLFLHR